uniref:Putative secreted protein n=1 Tax=Anopheles darlingi TaxID=43151 RepID=A0A2M4DFW8_ANODA
MVVVGAVPLLLPPFAPVPDCRTLAVVVVAQMLLAQSADARYRSLKGRPGRTRMYSLMCQTMRLLLPRVAAVVDGLYFEILAALQNRTPPTTVAVMADDHRYQSEPVSCP